MCGGKIVTISIAYQGNHRVCIRCGGLGHHHGRCGGAPGSGRDWSRNFLVPDNSGHSQTHDNEGGGNEAGEEGNNNNNDANNNNGNNNNNNAAQTYNNEEASNDQQPQQQDADIDGNMEEESNTGGVTQLPLQNIAMSRYGNPVKVDSPSDYESATEGSLDKEEGAGGWCMFVPDFNISLEDLQDEDEDALLNPNLWPSTEMVMGDASQSEEGNSAIINDLNADNSNAMIEWTPPLAPDNNTGVVGRNFKPITLNNDPFDYMVCGGYGLDSGLLDMIVNPLVRSVGPVEGPTEGQENALMMTATPNAPKTDTCMLPCLKRSRDVAIKGSEGVKTENKQEGKSLELLYSKLAQVVERVEKAVRSLPATTKSKKIKSSIAMSAAEIRDFTKLLEERTTVEGLLLEDDKAVVVLSSDSSDGSEGRGTKRKSRGVKDWERATAVSSRLRGKSKFKNQMAAEIIKKAHHKKIKKIPIRKIKAGGIKINTNLTLAPPSPGNVAT